MDNTNINKENMSNHPQANRNVAAQKASAPPLFNNAALPRHRIMTDVFDKVAMVLNFVLTFLFIKSVLFADHSSWKATASYLGIFALATAFIAVKQKTVNAQAIITGALCVAASMSFALRENENPGEIKFWVIIMLIYLSGSYCIALTNSNRHSRNSYFFLLDVVKTEVLLPLKHFFLPYAAIQNTRKVKKNEKGKGGKKIDKKYLAAIIGIVCAIPVLFVVVPLLLKGDAAFESVTGSFFEKINDYLSNFDSGFKDIVVWFDENLFYVLPTVFAAPYIFSVMFSFRHSVANEENKDTSPKYAKLRFGSPSLFSGFLGVICLVYVIYLLSQTAYFFSAFGGKLPGGTEISLAQYARRGFFELAGVAGVNLALIAVTVIFSKRNGGKFSPVIKVFDLFLCAFNILLSAISMSKIVLYMNEMGLTHKRIYVFVIDVVMIVTFLCVAVRLFNNKFPYMRVITTTACVLLTALSLIGIDGIISNYNTEMYLKNEIESNDFYDLFGGSQIECQIGSFKNFVKIAESKKPLKSEAKRILAACIGSEDESFYTNYSSFLTYKNGKFKLFCNDYIFNIDAHRALKIANEHIDTMNNAVKEHIGFDEKIDGKDVYLSEIYVSNKTSLPLKSIAVTVYNGVENESETSVVENADGSPIEYDDTFKFEFKKTKITIGSPHVVGISITDNDNRVYSATAECKTPGEPLKIKLESSDDIILATGGDIYAVLEANE